MGADIKLKDLFGQTQTEQDISTVSVPKADGTGREYYVKRPVIYYNLVEKPPYAPEGEEDVSIFWNVGDGYLFDEATIDIGNCAGESYAPVSGKTTKPFIYIQVSKYLQGVTADNTGKAVLIYLYETLAGATLLEVLEKVGTADFTAQPGWGQLIQGADGQTYTYTQLTDLGGIAIGIEQPNRILNRRLFFSFLTEKTNSVVDYTATENGEHTIVPPVESSGISAVSLTVNVPGGGGNDYYLLKNPTGTMPTYEGGVIQYSGNSEGDFRPHVTVMGGLNANTAAGYKNTEVFSYKKESSSGFTTLLFFWYAEDAETLSAALMQQFTGSWPFGDVTLAKGWNITTFSANGGETTASTTAATLDAVNVTLQGYGGIPKNNFDWAAMDAYTLSFFKDAAEPAGADAKSWVFTNGVASISQADFNKYLAPDVAASIFIKVPLEPVGGTGYGQMLNVMRSASGEIGDGSAQLVFAGTEYSLDETADPKILTPTVGGFGIISRASADANFILSYVNSYGNTITPAFTSNGVQVTLYAQLLQL